jgi:hypothetical protein
MTAATTSPSTIRLIRPVAFGIAAAATLIAASPGTATAASPSASAFTTAPSGQAASMCSPAQVAAATCLNYAITAGGDPWVSAMTNEMAHPGGEAIAAKFVASRGKYFHDAEQAKLEGLIKSDVHADVYLSPARPPDGIGTAAQGGSAWDYQSFGEWGPCSPAKCTVYDKVNFRYAISTNSHWVLTVKYQNTDRHHLYQVTRWDCDLRLDQGRVSKHLASWSICQENTGAISSYVIDETSTTATGDQRNWQFGRFTFGLGPAGVADGVILKFSFDSKRWYVKGNGGTFY